MRTDAATLQAYATRIENQLLPVADLERVNEAQDGLQRKIAEYDRQEAAIMQWR